MARCKATTKSGNQCRNMAMEGSEFCNVHAEQAEDGGGRAYQDPFADLGEGVKTLLGIAAAGAVVLLALKLGKRF